MQGLSLVKRITVKVFRYNPEKEEKPKYEAYEVPFEEKMTVLDVLTYIYENYDGSLAFRRSCRVGICGVCMVRVNGKAVLACTKIVNEKNMTIEPLPRVKIVRDLVTEVDEEAVKVKEKMLQKGVLIGVGGVKDCAQSVAVTR
jgi:succinate dehydrogenase/fumarate reductase iron-sulfur protein